jgi:predicted peroxiredoxin
MKLGILVNTDRHLDALIGLANAALAKGHEIILFAMDDGTRLLMQPACAALCTKPNVTMSFCDHSAQRLGLKTDTLPAKIISGSQYNNAAMMHNADKVIVL